MHSQNYKLTPAPSENCFAIFLLRVRSNQNTAVFTNFVQFHHASSAVGRTHIASYKTGLRPAEL
jgi:hypothetical protein